jgi:predicted hydrocarbon binding protein/KaiC/GvpD/RAD55 family RecA-like ATPase
MNKGRASLADIQTVPQDSLLLLVGPPGGGKSTFCHNAVLNGLALDRPVIVVTTEGRPDQILSALRERGLGQPAPEALRFVDAFSQTVGVAASERPDTIQATCMDLNSISIAITKLQERMGQGSILLAFDSLTSPYLFSGAEVVKFMRLFLSRFAAEGNAVVALIDEGCGKPEDLVAMMSIADGVIKIATEGDRQRLNVVKHPKARPTTIDVPIGPSIGLDERLLDAAAVREFTLAMMRQGETTMRGEVGDYVNLFWPNLAHWSCVLWDPESFAAMTYELNKDDYPSVFRLGQEDEEVWRAMFPWRFRLMLKLMPKNFSQVEDMKKPITSRARTLMPERVGTMEYLEDVSRTDEHYVRVHESSDCWGFESVGSAMASYLPPLIAGMCMALESLKGLDRDWNAVETRCIGLGDPYCEFKLVPGEIDELKDSLHKDRTAVERIHERLMERLMGFLLDGRPLVDRPRLGSDVHLHPVGHAFGFPHLAGERYQMAMRMGGARSGREVGEGLMDAGLGKDEAVKRVLSFLEHCKVGKVTLRLRSGQALGEAIRIRENCESAYTKVFTRKWQEPSCYFTTGFLNGLFSAVKNQHVREVKCIAAGDPVCEWEII